MFNVPAKYESGNIVLIRQLIEGIDCLALGIVREVEARRRESVTSVSYRVALDVCKEVSVPESEILIQLDTYESLYRHSVIEFFRRGKGSIAAELDRRESEIEQKRRKVE